MLRHLVTANHVDLRIPVLIDYTFSGNPLSRIEPSPSRSAKSLQFSNIGVSLRSPFLIPDPIFIPMPQFRIVPVKG